MVLYQLDQVSSKFAAAKDVTLATILLQRKAVKLAANLCCEKRQIDIKVAEDNFFRRFFGTKLSVSAIQNDDEHRKQNFY